MKVNQIQPENWNGDLVACVPQPPALEKAGKKKRTSRPSSAACITTRFIDNRIHSVGDKLDFSLHILMMLAPSGILKELSHK